MIPFKVIDNIFFHNSFALKETHANYFRSKNVLNNEAFQLN